MLYPLSYKGGTSARHSTFQSRYSLCPLRLGPFNPHFGANQRWSSSTLNLLAPIQRVITPAYNSRIRFRYLQAR